MCQLRRCLRDMDPDIPMAEVQTLPEIVHRWLRDDRAVALFLAILAGLSLALLLRSHLCGVSGVDPVTFAGVVALLLAVGLLAGYFLARHATRIDPIQALRQE